MGRVEDVSGTVKCLSQHGQLLDGQGRVARVDGLVHAGEDNCGVACEFTGRKDRVAIPRSIGKAGWREQSSFSGA